MKERSLPLRRAKLPVRDGGVLRHLYADIPAPTREEALARILSKPGLYASMSDEARELWDNYDGPEVLGPPNDDARWANEKAS